MIVLSRSEFDLTTGKRKLTNPASAELKRGWTKVGPGEPSASDPSTLEVEASPMM